VNEDPLEDESPIARCTFQAKVPTTEKKRQTLTPGGSSWADQSSLSDCIALVTQTHSQRYLFESQPPLCSVNKTAFLDNAVEPRAIKPNNEGTEDYTASESDDEEVSEHLFNSDYCSSDWEDSVSKGDLSVDEKEDFPWADIRPELVSRPSLLTVMMYGATPLSIHPAKAARAGAFGSSLSLQPLHTPPNGPSLVTPQDYNDGNILMMPSVHNHYSKRGTPTPSSSFPIAFSPMPTRENMLVDELDESLRQHLHWEQQQKNTTANAFFNRKHKAHNMVDQECSSSWKSAHENLKVGPDDNVSYGLSAGTEQSHENNPWNHYFDGKM
jgi:hypothetical protein